MAAGITRAFNRRKPDDVKGAKTDVPRRFSAEPNLRPLLDVMPNESGGPGAAHRAAEHARDGAQSSSVALEGRRAPRRASFRRWATDADAMDRALEVDRKDHRRKKTHTTDVRGLPDGVFVIWTARRGAASARRANGPVDARGVRGVARDRWRSRGVRIDDRRGPESR